MSFQDKENVENVYFTSVPVAQSPKATINKHTKTFGASSPRTPVSTSQKKKEDKRKEEELAKVRKELADLAQHNSALQEEVEYYKDQGNAQLLASNPSRVRKIMALTAEKEELTSVVHQQQQLLQQYESIIESLKFKVNQEKHARLHAELHAKKLQEAFQAELDDLTDAHYKALLSSQPQRIRQIHSLIRMNEDLVEQLGQDQIM